MPTIPKIPPNAFGAGIGNLNKVNTTPNIKPVKKQLNNIL